MGERWSIPGIDWRVALAIDVEEERIPKEEVEAWVVEGGTRQGRGKGTNLLIILNPFLHAAKVVDFQRWQFRLDGFELRNKCVVAETEDAVDLGEFAE